MDEWFKARTSWGSAIRMLSDAEAGRFIKAVYEYIDHDLTDGTSGQERLLVAMAIESLREDRLKRSRISELRSEAGAKGGKVKAMRSKFSNCQQNIANESNCCKKEEEKELSPLPPEGDGGGFIADEDAGRFQAETSKVLDAALAAGFGDTEAVRNTLVALCAEYSHNWVLRAIREAVESTCKGKPPLALLRSILERFHRQGGPDVERKSGADKLPLITFDDDPPLEAGKPVAWRFAD